MTSVGETTGAETGTGTEAGAETGTDTTAEAPAAGAPAIAGRRTLDAEAALAAVDRRGRRRWPHVLIGAVAGGAAVWAISGWIDGRTEEADAEQQAPTLATAPVEQRDVQEEIEWAGTLGYGQPTAVAGATGTVTATAEPGSTLVRGDLVAEVDDQPVVLFYGTTPMWRTMADGDEGADVLQLEANLAALGYDPDATVDVDGVFTANTEAMVERWQEALGREATGTVGQGDVVIVEGPSSLVSVSDVGSAASGTLATLAPRRAVADQLAGLDGTITELAPVGTPVTAGTTLFRIDDVPVVAIEPADAVATVLLSPTFTTTELEEALAADGHDPEGEMTVDGVVTAATEAAMERWQQASGLPVTGRAEVGFYLPVADGHRVDQHLVTEATDLTTGGPVLTTTVSRLSVAVTVDVAEADEFEVGQQVTIELADESTADGVVSEIGAVVQATDPQGTPTVTVTVDVAASDDRSLVEGPVTVVSIGQEIVGATVVPVRALVALAEGGFAVEQLVDGTPTLIRVELGSFDDGVVELIDPDLSPGDEVVVPR